MQFICVIFMPEWTSNGHIMDFQWRLLEQHRTNSTKSGSLPNTTQISANITKYHQTAFAIRQAHFLLMKGRETMTEPITENANAIASRKA